MKPRFTNKFVTSPKWKEMEEVIRVEKEKGTSLRQIYDKIKKIDPNIPSLQYFYDFLKRASKEVQENKRSLLELVGNETMKNVELLDIGMQKAMVLGNVVMAETLEEVKGLLQEGKEIPDKKKFMIMKWFKEAGDLYIDQQTLKVKQAGAITDRMAISVLARAARAGNLKEEDVGMQKVIPEPVEVKQE